MFAEDSLTCRKAEDCVRRDRPKKFWNHFFAFALPPQRAAAASLAMACRCAFESFLALASPPALEAFNLSSIVIEAALSFPRATAAGFFVGRFIASNCSLATTSQLRGFCPSV